MRKEAVAYYQLRLNLDDERQVRVYNDLEKMNPELWKSKNQYIIEALDYYGKNNGNAAQMEHEEQFKKSVVSEIAAVVHEEIMTLLGKVFQVAVSSGGNARTVVSAEDIYQSPDRHKADEFEKTAKDLVNAWDDLEEDANGS